MAFLRKLHSLFEEFFLNQDKVKIAAGEHFQLFVCCFFFLVFLFLTFSQFTQKFPGKCKMDQDPLQEGTQEGFVLVFLIMSLCAYMRQNQNFAI